MHLYVIARGQPDEINRWENDLHGQFLDYEIKNKNVFEGDKIPASWRLSMREIKLYEVVFPEPQLEKVLNMIKPSVDDYGGRYKIFHKTIKILKSLLGLKPIPKWEKKTCLFDQYHQHVGVHAIGIKKDMFKNEIEML